MEWVVKYSRRSAKQASKLPKRILGILDVNSPAEHTDVIKRYLADQGCVLEELVDPSAVFPERSAGTLLRGSRNREGMSQQQLAEICGISRRHISEMENGKRTISKQSAAKLSSALNVDPRLFL
jgi:DNA-binding XRE family transcriptional regulator